MTFIFTELLRRLGIGTPAPVPISVRTSDEVSRPSGKTLRRA